jgi:hypothetical protein
MSDRSQTSSPARKPRDPSLRDREIHRRVKVGCQRQCQVAADFGLSPGQVSRIVRRVEAWRGTQQPEQHGELSYAAQQRVGRWLAQERAEEMYAEARRLVEEAGGGGQESGVGSQEEDRGQETEDSAAELRRLAVRMQAIKTALKAAQEVYELSQAEPPPPPSPAEDQEAWQKQAIQELARMRKEAEEAGKVPRSLSPYVLAKSLLSALVGGPQYLLPRGAHGPGTAYWQVAEDLVSGSGDEATLRAHFGKPADLNERSPQESEPIVPSTEFSVLGTEDEFAQQRNIHTTEMGEGGEPRGDVANDFRPATYGTERDVAIQPEAPARPPEKSAKLRTGEHADDATDSDGPPRPAPEVGSPEWQSLRTRWLADRDRRAVLEGARKIAERYEREADLRERRAVAAARRNGIRSTEPWILALTPDS